MMTDIDGFLEAHGYAKGVLFISIADAAALLGVSRKTAYRMADDGRLPVTTIGGRQRVNIDKLLEMYEVTQ